MATSLSTYPGSPLPPGASLRPDGINFSLFSRHATAVELVILGPAGEKTFRLDPEKNRTGHVWHLLVRGIDRGSCYGYRVHGPSGPPHRFDPQTVLVDPYARSFSTPIWGKTGPRLGRVPEEQEEFDWGDDRPPRIPMADSVIYELHVRSFTIRDRVAAPGTFAGLVEKIPYLKELGITAVELMPVCEFDETDNPRRNPETGEKLKNLWGYAPIGLFAPKASFCADMNNPVREFKTMVREMHRAGIEVILDMVFNHSGEGDETGRTTCFRGIDNAVYYLTNPETGQYLDHTGCGHTVNCNHPVVSDLIIDCLRYWVCEMHVDGFRFDLAPVIARSRDGQLQENPPLLERINADPVLAEVKLIAEPWDAAGAMMLGGFSQKSPRWSEWNGRFRDDVKGFAAAKAVSAARLATRIAGSADIFSSRGPGASINYITCHDGFTLHDLVSYSRKHNQANGEDNRDGMDDPFAWNSGCEGECADPEVNALRRRRIRSMAALLLLSQGAVMIAAGDEFGRSQQGNNNPWCQDNPTAWLDWNLAEENRDLIRFFAGLIRLRREHACFRREEFFADDGSEVAWCSAYGKTDWSDGCRTLAMFLKHRRGGRGEPLDFCLLANGTLAELPFTLHEDIRGKEWRMIVDTAAPPPADLAAFSRAPLIVPDRQVTVAGPGVALLAAPA